MRKILSFVITAVLVLVAGYISLQIVENFSMISMNSPTFPGKGILSIVPLVVAGTLFLYLVLLFRWDSMDITVYDDDEEEEEDDSGQPKPLPPIKPTPKITVRENDSEFIKEKEEAEQAVRQDYLSEIPKTDISKERKRAKNEWSDM